MTILTRRRPAALLARHMGFFLVNLCKEPTSSTPPYEEKGARHASLQSLLPRLSRACDLLKRRRKRNVINFAEDVDSSSSVLLPEMCKVVSATSSLASKHSALFESPLGGPRESRRRQSGTGEGSLPTTAISRYPVNARHWMYGDKRMTALVVAIKLPIVSSDARVSTKLALCTLACLSFVEKVSRESVWSRLSRERVTVIKPVIVVVHFSRVAAVRRSLARVRQHLRLCVTTRLNRRAAE